MEHSFWHDKWENNQLGFHLNDVHPLLKKYFEMVFSSSDSVFVPLCGKSLDMHYLTSKNRSVVGCELSEVAAKDFFLQESDKLEIVQDDKFLIYSTANDKITTKILVGDYFDTVTDDLKACASIYDRAALIALPKKMRNKYVNHLKILMPRAKMLLITLDYDQNEMSGPPFSVDQNEIGNLFSFANIELLKRTNIIENESHFKNKGLTEFNQTAYFLNWDLTN